MENPKAVDGIAFSRAAVFQIGYRKSGVVFRRQQGHGMSDARKGTRRRLWPCEAGWHVGMKTTRVQTAGLPDLFGDAQVGEMNRIECASQNDDFHRVC